MTSNANLYDSFFSTTSDTTNNTINNPNNTESKIPPNNTRYTTNNSNFPKKNAAADTRRGPMVAITTMVAGLLKAHHSMQMECRDGSTSVVLLAASFLYVYIFYYILERKSFQITIISLQHNYRLRKRCYSRCTSLLAFTRFGNNYLYFSTSGSPRNAKS